MTHKQGQELQGTYMEDIPVKISEQYKPPPRISLPITYAQRLSLNKQIQDSVPDYSFVLESNVKQQMNLLKVARKHALEKYQQCVECVKEERKLREEMKQRDVELREQEVVNSELSNVSQLVTNSLFITPNTSQKYTSSSEILVPTQVTSYSKILTPIPLNTNNANKSTELKSPLDRSPFNISDFEADTSSPFDNMELKSINDMEELAQVLKSEEPTYTTANVTQIYPVYPPVHTSLSQSHSNYTSYLTSNVQTTIPGQSEMYNNIPTQISSYDQKIYTGTNGYYYVPSENIPSSQDLNLSYPYMNFKSDIYKPVAYLENSKSSFKSVPDIMKALETEIDSVPNDGVNSNYSTRQKSNKIAERKNSTPILSKTKDDIEDPYNFLPRDLQELSKSVSSMGFPLARVARVCKLVGDDKKKVSHIRYIFYNGYLFN